MSNLIPTYLGKEVINAIQAHFEYRRIPTKFKEQRFRVYEEDYCGCPYCEGCNPKVGTYHYEKRQVPVEWAHYRNGRLKHKKVWVNPNIPLADCLPKVTNKGAMND